MLLGFHIKKSLMARELGRDDMLARRREWITLRQPRMREEPQRLVFVDETGMSTKLTRLRGRLKRGNRLKADTSFGHWKTQTFVAALRHDGLAAPWLIDGAMTREMFDTYVETQLAPAPGAGDMVILDNLAAHKSEKAKAALRRRGAWFRFSPPAAPT